MKKPSYSFNKVNKEFNIEKTIMYLLLIASFLLIGYIGLLIYLAFAK